MSDDRTDEGPAQSLKLAPLPRPLSSFVGRRAEISELMGVLSGTRLLTLVGPPGCGKTRLALEVANTCRERFPAGIALVDLAPVRDGAMAFDTVSAAVGASARSVRELTQAIGPASLLLFIDNA